MGIDAGFDIHPRLSKGIVDRQNWGRFIDFIKEHYKDDTQVEIKPNYISFKAGEHPKLPFEGHKFLRFSSKVSGSIAADTNVESYIDTVTRIAQANFGSRIRYWDEGVDQSGVYSWTEVQESIRSYQQLQRDELETPSSIAQFLSGTDPIAELDIAPFEIKHILGKGKGLVARFNISKGTRIICEKPLLRAGPMPRDELEGFLATKLKAMSRESQRQFLSLHNNFLTKNPFSGIFKTNALPCGSGSPVGSVYPTVCLINHSCMPNAHNSWNSAKEHETIHAIRSIEKGAEITISYDHGGTSSERQAFLEESFGFSCTCSCCTLPPFSLQASDNRRTQIKNLDDAIGDPFRMRSNPQESLRDCYSLIQVLDQEFDGCAGALISRLYYDAFQISIAHGDQARASIFAERAYKARVICEGEDSPETLRAKSLALKPAVHSSFEVYSRKWKSVRDSAPKGLDTVEFDKWLFRQKN
ncbi:putative set domain-containing protein 5 protein [Botrytis fragariae]|uniref:Putative set domain-containing protein 5 protein n=1 Tax=Botrytis fragariae TaxID=1964551 RepID=A0A8H6EL11_9HELO|nr:putative set domain-containing protein 5 protein [Botrytis fragariae]KAF5876089.1 putative set domain-containing protein 5 protein [Botrytis fragariae]